MLEHVPGILRMSRLPIPCHGSLRKQAHSPRISATQSLSSRCRCRDGDVQQPESNAYDSVRTESAVQNGGNKPPTSESDVSSKLRPPRRFPPFNRNCCNGSAVTEHAGGVLVVSGGGIAEIPADAADKQPETQPEMPRQKRKPRPSLSDRTIETLSQISPSPSNRSDRRRSSLPPPLWPASAMSNFRARPSSPTKQHPVPSLPSTLIMKSSYEKTHSTRSTTHPARPANCPAACTTASPRKSSLFKIDCGASNN